MHGLDDEYGEKFQSDIVALVKESASLELPESACVQSLACFNLSRVADMVELADTLL